jgi:hypothetical protein
MTAGKYLRLIRIRSKQRQRFINSVWGFIVELCWNHCGSYAASILALFLKRIVSLSFHISHLPFSEMSLSAMNEWQMRNDK